jgi:hypothetical protein
MWVDEKGTDVVRVLFGVAGTPFGVFSARGDRCAGKVWTLYNLVGVDPVLTPSRHWSLRGFQSVSRLKWHIVHVVPPDRVDERKERERRRETEGRRGFQASWGCAHEVVSIPVSMKCRLVEKQIFGDTDVMPCYHIQLLYLRLKFTEYD